MDDLSQRLDKLEARLARLEQLLGVQVAQSTPQPAQPPVTPAPPAPPQTEASFDSFVDTVLAEPPATPAIPVAPAEPVTPPPLPTPRPPVIAYPVGKAPKPAAAASATEGKKGALEEIIGVRWAGWIGAIVLVIGAILFVKFAYDQGWFPTVTPAGRVVALNLAGLALLAAGEFVFRRVNRQSAAGVWGAGVAMLFVATYAAYSHYYVYSLQVAMPMLLVVMVIGALLSMRAKLATIGALAMAGAYLAPLMLGRGTLLSRELAVYLTVVEVVGLCLAWWGGSRWWWSLRWLVLAGTIFCGIELLASKRFMMLFVLGMIFHAEMLIGAWTERIKPAIKRGEPFVLSSIVSLFMTYHLMLHMWDESTFAKAASVLLFAAFCLSAGLLLHRWGNRRRLSAALRGQAAWLVIAHVPYAYRGIAVPAAWSGIAVAMSALAGRMKWRVSAGMSVVTWMLGAGAIVYLHQRGLLNQHWKTGGQVLHWWTLAGWALAFIGQLMAFLLEPVDRATAMIRRPRFWQVMAAFSTIALVATSVLNFQESPPVATLTIVVWAWLLGISQWFAPRLGGAIQAAIVLALASVKWVVVDLMTQRLGAGWSVTDLSYGPVFNPLMGTGALILASIGVLFLLRRSSWLKLFSDDRNRVPYILLAAVMTCMTVGLTLEIDRIVERAISIGWTGIWDPGQVRQFGWTALWTASMSVQAFVLSRRGWGAVPIMVLFALALKLMVVDLLMYRLDDGILSVGVVWNASVLLAAWVTVGLCVAWWISARVSWLAEGQGGRVAAELLMLAILLVVGSLEVERWFFGRSDLDVGRQVGFSVWWAIVAVFAVVAGFIARRPAPRYAGLAILGITLLKVVVVDMHDAGTGWRIASFVALGLLLLGTSVVYGKMMKGSGQ